jgi:hypothetical protein
LGSQPDALLSNLKVELEKLEPMSQSDVVGHWWPSGQIFTRDRMAMEEGNTVPAHINAMAEVVSLRHSFDICNKAGNIAKKAISHLERKKRKSLTADRVGTKVFIGHGRSPVWRELKDFIQDCLRLPWDEFNRVPVAGIATTARLKEMLEDAAIALLVMTAEDEMADGGDSRPGATWCMKLACFRTGWGSTKQSCCWKKVANNSATFRAWDKYAFPREIFQPHLMKCAAC